MINENTIHPAQPNRALPLAFYYTVKVALNSLLEWIIRTCNRVTANVNVIGSPFLRAAVTGLFRFLGQAAVLLIELPRAEAFELAWKEERVIFVGRYSSAAAFARMIFKSEEASLQPLGKYLILNLNHTVKQWLSLPGAHLVAYDLSPLNRFRFRAPFAVSSPILIEQILALDTPIQTLLASPGLADVRQVLHRTERAGITVRPSREKVDFDLFYERMYLPYVQQRHGDQVEIDSYELLWQKFHHGQLLLIQRGEDSIGGTVVELQGSTAVGHVGGVLDADPALFKMGIYTLIVWSAIQWAYRQGAARFSLGNSFAFRSNGIYKFKQSFTPRINRYVRHLTNPWTFVMQNPSDELLDHLNQCGLLVEHRRKFYGLIFSNAVPGYTPADQTRLHKKAVQDGLSGIVITTPNQTAYLNAKLSS